jgi:hypothetical protein
MRKTEPEWMGVATGLLAGQLTNRSSIPGKGHRFVCSAVSRPAVGPTLLLVGGGGVLEGCRVIKLTSYLHLVLMLRNEWICTSIPPHAFMACTGTTSLQSYLKQNRIDLFPK